jgi:hypothetical protein
MKLFLNENPIRVSYRAISTETKASARTIACWHTIWGIEAARQVSLERFRRMLGMLDHFGILSIAARANPAHRLFSIGEPAAIAIQCER